VFEPNLFALYLMYLQASKWGTSYATPPWLHGPWSVNQHVTKHV